MGLFIWSTTPSKIFVWDTQISKVFVWDTQVRPTSPTPTSQYHIPTDTERTSIKTLMADMWVTTWSNYSEYLKIPICWNRSNDTTVQNTSSASLWSSVSTTTGTSAKFIVLYLNSASISNKQRAYGLNVRCFANTPVTPDGTRTTMYQNSGKWVYWNSWLGIISITDWNTVITIKDKNEWATTVFNYWDTLTAANTWNTYQRWNMYAFPSTKDTTTTITTSSTQVDTTGYGSGTWYSSSTFITWNNDWSNPSNNNLWNWAPAPTSI